MENDTRVFSQAYEYLAKHKSINTFNQVPRLKEIAAPICPNPNLNTNAQQVTTWKHKTRKELIIIGKIKLCVWKKRVRGLRMAEANSAGINQSAYVRASMEIVVSWPMRIKILSMKIHIIVIGAQIMARDITAVCVYIPNFSNCPAP